MKLVHPVNVTPGIGRESASRREPHRLGRSACLALGALCLFACSAGNPGAGSKVVAPDDMPDICQDLDFNRDVEMREICGVKTRDYLAYRNVPEHRNLLLPKGGKIIKKGKALELRLPNTLPAPLPAEMSGKVLFDEKLRRSYIKSRMDYCEFFPENSTHNVKIIKLDIPQDLGGEATVCFTVESRPTTAQRKTGFANRLEPLPCGDFIRLKSRSLTQDAPVPDLQDPTEDEKETEGK